MRRSRSCVGHFDPQLSRFPTRISRINCARTNSCASSTLAGQKKRGKSKKIRCRSSSCCACRTIIRREPARDADAGACVADNDLAVGAWLKPSRNQSVLERHRNFRRRRRRAERRRSCGCASVIALVISKYAPKGAVPEFSSSIVRRACLRFTAEPQRRFPLLHHREPHSHDGGVVRSAADE